MADSTCLPVGDIGGSTRLERREARERRRIRRELTRRIEVRGLAAVQRMVNDDAPARFGVEAVSCAHIAYQSALTLGGMWAQRRPMRPAEMATFRILGGLGARAGLSEDVVLGALDSAVQEMVGAVEREATGDHVRGRGRVVVAGLRADARAFGETAAAELRVGYDVERQYGADLSGVLAGILDGRVADDEVALAASTVGVEADRGYGVVLLVGGDGPSLGETADAIVARVPYAVDLGPGSCGRLHHRLLVPQLTPGQWMDARVDLHVLATQHGVLAVAPAAAACLAGTADVYHRALDGLGALLAQCGVTSGIVDPALVATATAGEVPVLHTAA